jgi:hypothetical protein
VVHLNIKSGYSMQNALLREGAHHVFAWVTGQEQDDRARTSQCQGKPPSQPQGKDKPLPLQWTVVGAVRPEVWQV